MKKLLVSAFFILLVTGAAQADTIGGDIAYVEGNYAAAYREWSKAADAGDSSAMAAIGTLYDTGHGVPQDFSAALDWYRRSAEAGSVRGMFNAGAMYDNGRGTAMNRLEAVHWYRMAAERGDGRAAFALGLIYRDGDGVPRDRGAAVRYFRIASTNGIRAADTDVARLERRPPPPARTDVAILSPRMRSPGEGKTRPQSAEVQQAVLARAPLDTKSVGVFVDLVRRMGGEAGAGNGLGQYDLGYAFEYGHGTRRNPVKSYVYYLRAAASPDAAVKAAALRGATSVGGNLSEAQHVEARDMLLNGSR